MNQSAKLKEDLRFYLSAADQAEKDGNMQIRTIYSNMHALAAG